MTSVFAFEKIQQYAPTCALDALREAQACRQLGNTRCQTSVPRVFVVPVAGRKVQHARQPSSANGHASHFHGSSQRSFTTSVRVMAGDTGGGGNNITSELMQSMEEKASPQPFCVACVSKPPSLRCLVRKHSHSLNTNCRSGKHLRLKKLRSRTILVMPSTSGECCCCACTCVLCRNSFNSVTAL